MPRPVYSLATLIGLSTAAAITIAVFFVSGVIQTAAVIVGLIAIALGIRWRRGNVWGRSAIIAIGVVIAATGTVERTVMVYVCESCESFDAIDCITVLHRPVIVLRQGHHDSYKGAIAKLLGSPCPHSSTREVEFEHYCFGFLCTKSNSYTDWERWFGLFVDEPMRHQLDQLKHERPNIGEEYFDNVLVRGDEQWFLDFLSSVRDMPTSEVAPDRGGW